MKNKLFIVATLMIAFLFFAVSYTFAANNVGSDMVNGVRNFVGGAENTIENIGSDAAKSIRNGMNTLQNGAENTTNAVRNGVNNNSDNMARNANNNTGYTATRTTADTTGNNIFANIPNTVWSWLVVGIVGVLIVSLVMYYAKQNNNVTTYHGHNDDNER
ncbi:MAG: hypothetical protein IJ777_00150 [Clostridia bacterium]|nr:hypothetical protein [Clostridia bacterium]